MTVFGYSNAVSDYTSGFSMLLFSLNIVIHAHLLRCMPSLNSSENGLFSLTSSKRPPSCCFCLHHSFLPLFFLGITHLSLCLCKCAFPPSIPNLPSFHSCTTGGRGENNNTLTCLYTVLLTAKGVRIHNTPQTTKFRWRK